MVVKVIELIGSSPMSWEEATKTAITKAGESLKNIHSVDVLGFKAVVENGKIKEYRTNVKIAFVIE
ncbi:MAG TPA: dodecin family protein [Nitrosarchaeum sp.]